MVSTKPGLVGTAQSLGQEPIVMRILLTGSDGQLGTDITKQAALDSDIELHGHDIATLDITNADQVNAMVAEIEPDVIIHGAAYTAVDDCESNEEIAFAVNEGGTANLAAAAKESGTRMLYVSTDYVFDGSKDTPYVETDTPNPASVYGASKLAGETHVAALDNSLIARTSWVCGAHGSNMVKTILNAAEKYPQLTFVDDQIGKPTFTSDLAGALLTLAKRDETGIMHVTNEGAVSWYEFCQSVLKGLGKDPAQVSPCATSELDPPRPAPRPANSVLENTRFPQLGIPLLRHYEEPLKEVLRDLTT